MKTGKNLLYLLGLIRGSNDSILSSKLPLILRLASKWIERSDKSDFQESAILLLLEVVIRDTAHKGIAKHKIIPILDSVDISNPLWIDRFQKGFGLQFFVKSLLIDVVYNKTKVASVVMKLLDAVCNSIKKDPAADYNNHIIACELFSALASSKSNDWTPNYSQIFDTAHIVVRSCVPFTTIESAEASLYATMACTLVVQQLTEARKNKKMRVNADALSTRVYELSSIVVSCQDKMIDRKLNNSAITLISAGVHLSDTLLSASFQFGVSTIRSLQGEYYRAKICQFLLQIPQELPIEANSMTGVGSGTVETSDLVAGKEVLHSLDVTLASLSLKSARSSGVQYLNDVVLALTGFCMEIFIRKSVAGDSLYDGASEYSQAEGWQIFGSDPQSLKKSFLASEGTTKPPFFKDLDDFLLGAFKIFSKEVEIMGWKESAVQKLLNVCLEEAYLCCTLLDNPSSAMEREEETVHSTPKAGNEVAALMLISFVGDAATAIPQAEIKNFVFQGLQGVLNYRTTQIVVAGVVKQLARIGLSTGSLELNRPRKGVVIRPLFQIAVNSWFAAFDREVSMHVPLSTNSTAAGTTSNATAAESLAAISFEHMSGLVHGMRLLISCLSFSGGGSVVRLHWLREKFSELITRLVRKSYQKNLLQNERDGSKHLLRELLTEATGLLLPAVADCLEAVAVARIDQKKTNSLTSVEEETVDNGSFRELMVVRNLWFAMVLFRLKEHDVWEQHPGWLRAYQRIATFSHPLLYPRTRGISVSDGFFDREIQLDPYLTAITTQHLQSEDYKRIKLFAKFKPGSLNKRQMFFCITVQLMESLRSGGALDFRPMLWYLGDPVLQSSNAVRRAIIAMAEHAFTVWIESCAAHLLETTNTGDTLGAALSARVTPANHERFHISGLSYTHLQKFILYQFTFMVTRCSHRVKDVRILAIKFVKETLKRMTWLKFSHSGVYVLLDSITELESCLPSRYPAEESSFPEEEQRFDVFFTATFRAQGWEDASVLHSTLQKPRPTPFSFLLSSADLPVGDTAHLKGIAADVVGLSYWWLWSGLKEDSQLSLVLQEYLLQEHTLGSEGSSLGESIARELVFSSTPMYHLNPSIYASFRDERIAAAKKISTTKTVWKKAEAKSAAEFQAKSLHLGEVRGYEQSFLDSVGSVELILTDKGVEDRRLAKVSDQQQQATKALFDALQGNIDAGEKSEHLISVIWRSGCVVHNLLYQANSLGRSNPGLQQELRRSALALTQGFSSLIPLCFQFGTGGSSSKQNPVETAVSVWRWLLVSFPSIRIQVITIASSTARRAISHGNPNEQMSFAVSAELSQCTLKPQSATTSVSDIQSVGCILEFVVEVFESYPELSFPLVREFTEFLLAFPFSCQTQGIRAHFNTDLALLQLGLRLLRHSLRYNMRTGVAVALRRILREKIYSAALNLFLQEDSMLSNFSGDQLAETLDLWKFMADLRADTRCWSIDYTISASASAAVKSSQRGTENGSEVHETRYNPRRPSVASSVSSASNYESSFGGSQNGAPVVGDVVAGQLWEQFGPAAATIFFHVECCGKMSNRGRRGGFYPLSQSVTIGDPTSALDFLKHLHGALRRQRALGISLSAQSAIGSTDKLEKKDAKTAKMLFKSKKTSIRGTYGGHASGSLLVLQMLLLNVINRKLAWHFGNVPKLKDLIKAIPELEKVNADQLLRDIVALSNVKAFKVAIKSAWAYSSDFCIFFQRCFAEVGARDGKRKGINNMTALLAAASTYPTEPQRIGGDHRVVPLLLEVAYSDKCTAVQKDRCLKQLIFVSPSPLHLAIELLNRCSGSGREDGAKAKQNLLPDLMRYCVRSLFSSSLEASLFLAPQLVQVLRRDHYGAVANFLVKLSNSSSVLVCHELMWLLQTEARPLDPDEEPDDFYGFCDEVDEPDPLPVLSNRLLDWIVGSLTGAELKYMEGQIEFFKRITFVSSELKSEPNKERHSSMVEEFLRDLKVPKGAYFPTRPERRVLTTLLETAAPMQSAAKCPYLLAFRTIQWRGPDHFIKGEKQSEFTAGAKDTAGSLSPVVSEVSQKSPRGAGIGRKEGQFTSPRKAELEGIEEEKDRLSEASENNFSVDTDQLGDQEDPVMGFPGTEEINACIFKVHDDCRQDMLTIQVIKVLKEQYEARGLPVILVPYTVISNRTGPDRAIGGIVEVVPRAKSRDQLGKAGAKTLLQYFNNQFGPSESLTFQRAQSSFAASLAGSAIVCYLLNIKDRHNGNILIDDSGRLVHIDFGFILGISPGGNLGFEKAAFKLSAEMVQLLGGTRSKQFQTFKELTVRAFLIARQPAVMDRILALVSTYADSELPCFHFQPDALRVLRGRFVPTLNEMAAAEHMKALVEQAANHWTTTAYDGVQKMQNNIYSDVWQ